MALVGQEPLGGALVDFGPRGAPGLQALSEGGPGDRRTVPLWAASVRIRTRPAIRGTGRSRLASKNWPLSAAFWAMSLS